MSTAAPHAGQADAHTAAASPERASVAAVLAGTSYVALAVRMVLGLIAVGAIAVVVLRLYAARTGAGAAQGERLKVVDRCVLEPGRTLHLVEAPGRDLIVATHQGGTSLIAEIERQDDA